MSIVGKTLVGAGIVLAVMLAGIVIAISMIDVNTLVGPVKDRVQAATGRELTVGGGSSLALSLQPKLVLKDVALSNAPWGSAPKLLTARRLQVEFALLPLLSRRFDVIQLELVGPVVALETDDKGRRNWVADPAAPSQATAVSTAAKAGESTSFSVGNLLVTDGTLTFRDGPGAPTRVAINRLSLRARESTSPIAVEFKGDVAGVAVAVDATLGSLQDMLRRRGAFPLQVKGDIAGQKTAITAKVRVDDKNIAFDDLDFKIGNNALAGKLSIAAGEPRSKLSFDLTGPALVLKELPFAVNSVAPATAGKPAHPSPWLFPDTPVDFAPLRMMDAEGTLTVGHLQLASGQQFNNVRAAIVLAAGNLDVKNFELALFGGKLAGNVHVDARIAGHEALAVHAGGTGFDLAALLSAAGKPREVRGGKTAINIDLDMRGASPHAWASTASGNVRIVVGPATLLNTKLDLSSAIDKVAQAINPFRERDPSTELVCAVVRLPLANGIARVDRSIAMETQKVAVSATGTLDFRNETLDFNFHPKVNKGISIPGLNFADLVGLRGPFASPQVAVNAAGSVKAIASIGAAVGTAGLSTIGQVILGQMESGGTGLCAIALGAKDVPTDVQASTEGRPATSESVEKKIGGAIGKLFGR